MLSIPAQQEFAQEHATSYGLSIVDVIQESKSAKIPNKRPGFRAMMRGIKSGKYNAIICWKLDRLARNMNEGGEIIELLQQGRIKEIRTSEKVYLPNENAIVLAVVFASANQFSRDLSINVKRGLKKKAQMGIPHGVAPFGYLNVRDEHGNRYWKADPERLAILKTIFHKILERGMNPREVYRWAVETYHPTTVKRKRLGGKLLCESYFYKMLSNTLYAGFFTLDNQRYEVTASIPRVITEAQYYAVQRILHGPVTISKRSRHDAAYTGLLKSPEGEFIGADYKAHLTCDCGHKFSYVHRTHCPKCALAITDMKRPKYASYVYYYNVARKKRREAVKMLSEGLIEAKLKKTLADLQFSPEMKDWIQEAVQHIPVSDDAALSAQRLQKTVDELERKRKRLRDLLTDGIISREEYLSDLKEIEDKLGQIKVPDEEKEQAFKEGIKTAVNLYETLMYEPPERKRGALSRIGSNLVWDEKELYISWPKWILTLREGLLKTISENPEFEPRKSLANKGKTEAFTPVIPTLCKTLSEVRKDFYNGC